MQTFLPFPDFKETAKVLDYRRLGKQRVEAFQILRALEDPEYGWQNHPAVLMWRGFDDALGLYYNTIVAEWEYRGFRNTMKLVELPTNIKFPGWLWDPRLHTSHQSNLVRKDAGHYRKYFPDVPDDLPYYWPVQKSGGINVKKKCVICGSKLKLTQTQTDTETCLMCNYPYHNGEPALNPAYTQMLRTFREETGATNVCPDAGCLMDNSPATTENDRKLWMDWFMENRSRFKVFESKIEPVTSEGAPNA